MRKRIVGILVCMILIALPSGFVMGTTNQDTESVPAQQHWTTDQDIRQQSGILADWTQMGKLIASDGAAGDAFGRAVCISGDTAIVGAPYDDANKGSAYIFRRSGTSWIAEAKLTAPDGAAGDQFANAVCISGDTVIIGALHDDASRGSAYVFRRSGTSWAAEVKLYGYDGAASDQFGISVSIDGEYAVVGAYYGNSGRGAAYVFKRSGTSWAQQAKLTASDGQTLDGFGYSVSISGDYALIGSPHDDAQYGSAYIFKRSDTTWAQQLKLTASDGVSG